MTLAQPTATASKKPLPFSGIRVADFCWAVAGPVTSKMLAIMGAEVIKIESRTRLDGGRLGFPFHEGKPGVNKSGYFANHNTSKLSVRLDLSKPEAREVARRLVAVSDIVTESFSARVMNEWGLGWNDLVKVNNDLIMTSLTMQGQTGPYAGHVGFGRTLSGLAGLDNLTGWPDKPPAGPNEPYTDMVVPWFAVTALAAALRHRERTGRGQYLDLAQLEAAIHFLAPAFLDYTVNGRVMSRNGNRQAGAAPHNVYPCQGDDRWVAITIWNDAQWRNLCHGIGQSSLATDERFSTLLGRKANEAELDKIVGAWTSQREVYPAVDTLMRAGVPTAVVEKGEDLHRDEQLKHRDHLRRMEHPVMGLRTYSRPSFRFSNLEPDLRRFPLLGEHQDYVIQEVLGMSQAEVDDLRSKGVFE
ncbi:MAG: CoA transferase [Chloroflexi bacterium]|nr:CoA transferase [Chloroflexota bacterium]